MIVFVMAIVFFVVKVFLDDMVFWQGYCIFSGDGSFNICGILGVHCIFSGDGIFSCHIFFSDHEIFSIPLIF